MQNNAKKLALRERNTTIWNKYMDGVDENNIQQVFHRGMFLGLYEQLVRILRRNTEIFPYLYKNTDFFKRIVTVFVYTYCDILVKDTYPEGTSDIANITLSKFFNDDYDTLVDLPTPNQFTASEQNWQKYIKASIAVYGVNTLALLEILTLVSE